MRSREVRSFEVRPEEVGPFEMCLSQVGSFEVRSREVGSFEMRLSEVSSFERRLNQEGPPQVGQRKVQPPFPRVFALAASGITAIDDGQNRGNIGRRAIAMVSIYSRESRHLIFPASTLPDKSGQCLHDRPIIRLALPRDALQRINAAQANLEFIAPELLDRIGEAFGDAPL